ncbi:hypothetical protein PILCRDRAFT_817903 [Piloderma croceum F 1598]|uniref:Secreted protein n=1 Tax=Piloderma croceum (strain F 1598) TaxID=765440 RepID=A0A0C3FZ58_PILCF|nr:hypothetical protein PILCRDRAFT_817903 [Piloderma croceum F 1598]
MWIILLCMHTSGICEYIAKAYASWLYWCMSTVNESDVRDSRSIAVHRLGVPQGPKKHYFRDTH